MHVCYPRGVLSIYWLAGCSIGLKIIFGTCKLVWIPGVKKKKKSSIDLNSHLLFILPLRFFVIIQLARIHLTLDQLLLVDNVSPVVFSLLPFLIIKIIIIKKKTERGLVLILPLHSLDCSIHWKWNDVFSVDFIFN